jgi:hypothetical protein
VRIIIFFLPSSKPGKIVFSASPRFFCAQRAVLKIRKQVRRSSLCGARAVCGFTRVDASPYEQRRSQHASVVLTRTKTDFLLPSSSSSTANVKTKRYGLFFLIFTEHDVRSSSVLFHFFFRFNDIVLSTTVAKSCTKKNIKPVGSRQQSFAENKIWLHNAYT